MRLLILNAFSINMFNDDMKNNVVSFDKTGTHWIKKLVIEATKEGVEIVNGIGHKETCSIIMDMLLPEVTIPLPTSDRPNVVLEKDDIVAVAQYRGPRLLEGATSLPEGAMLEWWLIRFKE